MVWVKIGGPLKLCFSFAILTSLLAKQASKEYPHKKTQHVGNDPSCSPLGKCFSTETVCRLHQRWVNHEGQYFMFWLCWVNHEAVRIEHFAATLPILTITGAKNRSRPKQAGAAPEIRPSELFSQNLPETDNANVS